MRTYYLRTAKLGFGKHAETTIVDVRRLDPTYFLWMHDNGVIRFGFDKDQRWFTKSVAKIRRDLGAAAVIASCMRDDDDLRAADSLEAEIGCWGQRD